MIKPFKVLVTGSRGKSSVVRLLHAAFSSCGLRTCSRITGVIPRSLTPDGEVTILRSTGAHVSEMNWWLRGLPSDVEAIVMENSAVSPSLQPLAPSWMRPDVIVLTNIRPDHQDAWGEGEVAAAIALSAGIPVESVVALSPELADRELLMGILHEKSCRVILASSLGLASGHMASNMSVALEVCRFFNLNLEKAMASMSSLPPDIADFEVLNVGRAKLAFAFSANDLNTSEELFRSLDWRREDTTVLFNHRRDRGERFRAFKKWLNLKGWKNSIVIGDRPLMMGGCKYIKLDEIGDLMRLIEKEGLVFGCGNVVYGLPLELKLFVEKNKS